MRLLEDSKFVSSKELNFSSTQQELKVAYIQVCHVLIYCVLP